MHAPSPPQKKRNPIIFMKKNRQIVICIIFFKWVLPNEHTLGGERIKKDTPTPKWHLLAIAGIARQVSPDYLFNGSGHGSDGASLSSFCTRWRQVLGYWNANFNTAFLYTTVDTGSRSYLSPTSPRGTGNFQLLVTVSCHRRQVLMNLSDLNRLVSLARSPLRWHRGHGLIAWPGIRTEL